MADCKAKSFAGQIQLLMENSPEFTQRFKQRLVFESSKVANPLKFIGGLLSKGLLCDGSKDSEASFGLKEWMVQLATTMVCSEGADAIGGLIEALEESENFQLISALRTWAKKDFGMETAGDLSEPKEVDLVGRTSPSDMLDNQPKNRSVLSSSAIKLIDKFMSHEEKDLIEQLGDHLLGMASSIFNSEELCFSLVPQGVLDESAINLKIGLDSQVKSVEKAIKAACSMRAVGSLVNALQHTDNEHILTETYEWLETLQARKNNYPIAVRSLANHRDEPTLAKSSFFEQPAPLDDLEKVAVFNCQPEASPKGALSMEFSKDRMLVYLTDGTIYLKNWRDNEEKTMEFGAKVKEITSIQYDEEICILGTVNGTVYLFDARTLEVKWLIRLGEPVQSLKFFESTLIVVTRGVPYDNFWQLDISREDMRLSNKRPMRSGSRADTGDSGVFINRDCSFLHWCQFVYVHDKESGQQIKYRPGCGSRLIAPAAINTLTVVDLISTKDVVIAGCTNGVIAMWNFCKTSNQESPVRIFQGQTEAIVSLCALTGHLLSVDKSGKFLMWSGYDLENNNRSMRPIPQVLAVDFYNVNCLVAHERWVAASSSEDSVVNIWTLPDLWLRTG